MLLTEEESKFLNDYITFKYLAKFVIGDEVNTNRENTPYQWLFSKLADIINNLNLIAKDVGIDNFISSCSYSDIKDPHMAKDIADYIRSRTAAMDVGFETLSVYVENDDSDELSTAMRKIDEMFKTSTNIIA